MATSKATAVVAGAGGGIGAAVVDRLLSHGYEVVAVDGQARKLAALPGAAVSLEVDVSSAKAVRERIAPVFSENASVLVNCAAVLGTGDIAEIDEVEWERVLRVNLTGVHLLCRAAVPGMRARGRGRIVNCASVGGQAPAISAGVHYSATKAGVIGYTRTLARQVAPDGITANVVSPGRIDTPMFREAHSDPDALRPSVPLGRIGAPADIAGAVAFLASDDGAFITGATLDVNGGSLMR